MWKGDAETAKFSQECYKKNEQKTHIFGGWSPMLF
jgi:hypothetical protein